MLRFLPELCYFAPDSPQGGDWEDKSGYDRELAFYFREALKLQQARKLSTRDPFGLASYAQKISDRYNEAGLLLFLERELQPIAKRLMTRGPSDRTNPVIIQTLFEDFDLSHQ